MKGVLRLWHRTLRYKSTNLGKFLWPGVPVCLVKDKNLPYLYVDGRYKKKPSLYT